MVFHSPVRFACTFSGATVSWASGIWALSQANQAALDATRFFGSRCRDCDVRRFAVQRGRNLHLADGRRNCFMGGAPYKKRAEERAMCYLRRSAA